MSSLTNPIFGPHSSFSLTVPRLGLTAHIVSSAHGHRLAAAADSPRLRVPNTSLYQGYQCINIELIVLLILRMREGHNDNDSEKVL